MWCFPLAVLHMMEAVSRSCLASESTNWMALLCESLFCEESSLILKVLQNLSSIVKSMVVRSTPKIIFGVLAAINIIATAGSVKADCPDYSDYSQQYHAPFSSGRYNLSYMRPEPACRTFNSSAVESTIASMKNVIKDPDLFRLFENSFPNTLDTAVKWKGVSANNSREELTFLITGDINVCSSHADR